MLRLDRILVERGAFSLATDFEVGVPKRIAVIGPSGGGKSTLLSLIAGFVRPDEGRMTWNGEDITAAPPAARPVAMLFQDNNLFPHLTVETNVALGIAPVARPPEAARVKAREALARVGIADQADKKPAALSGGQQSRAALARVLLTHKPVVLLDEPFAALGPALRREMLSLVADLLADRLVLMVTHDPDDARDWAEETIFIDEGRANAPVSSGELFADPPEALRRYLH